MMTKMNFHCRLVAVALMLSAFACGNSGRPAGADKQPSASTAERQETTQFHDPVPHQPTTAQPAQVIPEFTFYILRSGIRFTKQDLPKNGNKAFILFDPTCGHCQHEAHDIGKHYGELKDVNIYFVSMNDPGLMSTFLETWAKPLVDKPNVEMLYDRNADFINRFHIPSQYPATYVYGPDGRLKTSWNGERPARAVIDALKN
ncbi:peroxiredoxin family protein [Parapedobacter deserti]|uniref:Peroxiredoxin family protein n=1 Tax=Parapedobacter deserti TaxID=1912957 RepID=A0ABV7JMG4_9SPHI